MTFVFRRSRRLAQGWAVIVAATALAACAGERSISAPTPPPASQPRPSPIGGFYVSPNGSSAGNGSVDQPWDMATALASGGGRVQPGDTIWVRGGKYSAPFRSTVSGNASAPVVVRAYPRERAVIDGVNAPTDNFVVGGSYTILWGLEFTNTDPSRYTSVINHNYRANAIVNDGPHNKYINCVIHDAGQAFYGYSQWQDVEFYGSIIYNNGWQAPDRGHGHGLYLKSDAGPLVIRDNVLFNQYGYGLHVYTNVGDGLLNNIRLEGNVSFDNGSLASTGTSANIGNLGQPLANDFQVVSNMTYMAPSLAGENLSLGSGNRLTATDNYVVGGAGLSQDVWTGALVNANTVLAAGRTSQAPTVFVRRNQYESGRANIVVYNWNGQSAVSVNVGGVLNAGDRYEVHNVQDLFGAAVASGTFGGGSVSIPMTGVAAPVPVGVASSSAPRTGPNFDVFVITRL